MTIFCLMTNSWGETKPEKNTIGLMHTYEGAAAKRVSRLRKTNSHKLLATSYRYIPINYWWNSSFVYIHADTYICVYWGSAAVLQENSR